MLAELFQTLGQLSVRNEFCQEIMDYGGLQLILTALDKNIEDQVRVLHYYSARISISICL